MTTTPTTWLDSFQVSTSNISFQGWQDITGLSNGNFLVVFADDSQTVGTGDGIDIVGVIYNAQGDVVKTAFQVNTFSTAEWEWLPAVAATNDGGFVMAYEDRVPPFVSAQNLIERYDANGTSIDTGFVQSEPFNPPNSPLKIAVNQTDNSMFVTYQFWDSSGDSVRGKRLDANLNIAAGTPANGFLVRGNDEGVGTPGAGENNTAVLTNGDFVTVLSEPDSATSPFGLNIEFRISDGTTGANGIRENVTSGGGDTEVEPDVAALSGGGFVVVWRENETTSNGDDEAENIQFARYNNAGALQGSITTVIDSNNSYRDPAVIGLEDGGFFIAAHDSTDERIEGTRFDASGVRIGSEMFAIESGVRNFPDIELSLTTDGRILLTYDDPSGDIQAEILDPRDAGTITAGTGDQQTTARSDDDTTLIGVMDEADTLFGQEGNDVLYGGDITGPGAVDILYGGEGNDALDGQAANDQLYGGNGDDTIIGGGDADRMYGGEGLDTADYSASPARIEIRLSGAPGSGGDAEGDRLFGVENLFGSQFDDTLIGD
ncbi:MAG: calcium-binding protein, partial [Pseudomonadota bacterium]